MNQIKYDILSYLLNDKTITLETLAIIMDSSVKKIKPIITELIEDDYLTADLLITEKTKEEVSEKTPKNAIIVADDLGIGMLMTNKDIPAGLLEMNGEIVIERLIHQLHEVGIYDITIIIGFLGDKYEYLIDQYNVKLIYNQNFAAKSSLYSLQLVVDEISNTYILPANIWTERNPFAKEEFYSWYSIADTMDDSSNIRYRPQFGLMEVEENKGGNSIIGISYILKDDAISLVNNIKQITQKRGQEDQEWEKALFDQEGKMTVYPRIYKSTQAFPISDYKQLSELDSIENKLDSEIIELIATKLEVKPEDILDIFVLESGKTNRSFRFTAKDKQYIMRIPGEGTEELVNRENEYEIYKLLKGRKISDKVVYMSPKTGYKISEFIEGAHSCDPHNSDEVVACMKKLREFHDYKLEVEHTFNIFEEIDYYEDLRGDTPSKFKDYEETKRNVKELKLVIDSLPKEWILSHCDSVPGNFLLKDGEVYLIDWEYAGMQDAHIDIAMFALSAMYTRNELDDLLDYYFVEGYTEETKLKIYCYMAIGGLLWSNWSEYKEVFGVEFGEYSLRQYEYAKDYYEIVQKEYHYLMKELKVI